MAIEPVGIEPLEIFAMDAGFNRMTGSIPYRSLIWHRRYYEPGEFELYVPASIYDPEWSYIYTDNRPETGIIQKVEVTDDSTVAGGDDTVILSGFFLEADLNRFVFLIEETEQEKRYEFRPVRAQADPVRLWQNPETGELYVTVGSWPGRMKEEYREVYQKGWPLNEGHLAPPEDRVNVVENGFVEIPMTTTGGQSSKGDISWNGYEILYSDSYDFYFGRTEDGSMDTSQIISTDKDGTEHTYDTVVTFPNVGSTQGSGQNQSAIVRDEDGNYMVAPTIAVGENQTYKRQIAQWEENLGKWDVVDEFPGGVVHMVTVKGPYMVHLEIGDTMVSRDSVETVILYAQRLFGNTMYYDEPKFSGVDKVTDPTFQYFGDLAFSEMKEIQASVRVFFNFQANQMVFQLWKGRDLTQGAYQNDGTEEQAATMAVTMPTLPAEYTELEYIEGTGTQYIDTGVVATEGFSVDIDLQIVGFESDSSKESAIIGSHQESDPYLRNYFSYQRSSFQLAAGDSYAHFGTPTAGKRIMFHGCNRDQLIAASIDGTDQVLSWSEQGNVGYSPYTLMLFMANGGAQWFEPARMRVYSLKLYTDGPMLLNMVPARRDSDGAVGMYDTVSGQFFGNSGTGAFVEGPAIEYPDPEPTPVEKAPWAVFSDEWGTIYGYNASVDSSNYKNLCYVLYDYDVPLMWDKDGKPQWITNSYPINSDGTQDSDSDYDQLENESGGTAHIPWENKRGVERVRLEDGEDLDYETYLDLRSDKPPFDDWWSRGAQGGTDGGEEGSGSTQDEHDLTGLKEMYAAWAQHYKDEGKKELETNWAVVRNLDTGTLVTTRYLYDWDLGDKVDIEVSLIGWVETARIIEVEEVHESGHSEVRLTMGEQKLTTTDKAARRK